MDLTITEPLIGTGAAGQSYTIGSGGAYLWIPSLNVSQLSVQDLSASSNVTASNIISGLTGFLGSLNHVSALTGTPGTLVTISGYGPTLSNGTPLWLYLNNTLIAGANTLAYQGGAAVPVVNAFGNNLSAGYPSAIEVLLTYNGTCHGTGLPCWQVVGAQPASASFSMPVPTGQLVIGGAAAGTLAPGNLTGPVTTSGGTATTITPTGVAAGTYTSVTVATDGRVTAGTNPGITGGTYSCPSGQHLQTITVSTSGVPTGTCN